MTGKKIIKRLFTYGPFFGLAFICFSCNNGQPSAVKEVKDSNAGAMDSSAVSGSPTKVIPVSVSRDDERDHSKAGDRLKDIAKEKNVTLPPTIASDMQKKADDDIRAFADSSLHMLKKHLDSAEACNKRLKRRSIRGC